MHDIDAAVFEWKIKTLENKKKAIERALHRQDRKGRTRLLIQTGALCEKYFDIEDFSLSEREDVFKLFSAYVKNNIPSNFKK
ncbi:MAG TPA: hypothetical protein VFC58_11970 [Desulfosporosinus sp.]|nr:hypothetical protein [Desulfosporosinus sp.]